MASKDGSPPVSVASLGLLTVGAVMTADGATGIVTGQPNNTNFVLGGTAMVFSVGLLLGNL